MSACSDQRGPTSSKCRWPTKTHLNRSQGFLIFLLILSNIWQYFCGVSLHQGSTESRKTLKQKYIFQIGTLNPNGTNERFSFNQFIQLFFTLPGTNQ